MFMRNVALKHRKVLDFHEMGNFHLPFSFAGSFLVQAHFCIAFLHQVCIERVCSSSGSSISSRLIRYVIN